MRRPKLIIPPVPIHGRRVRTPLVAMVIAAPCLVLVAWEGVGMAAGMMSMSIAIRILSITVAFILRLIRILLHLLNQICLVLLILRTGTMLHDELLLLVLFETLID